MSDPPDIEIWKALAMILLAAAAISAASYLSDWLIPRQPQPIIIQMPPAKG